MSARRAAALLALAALVPAPRALAAPAVDRADRGTAVYSPIAPRVSADGRYVVFVAHTRPVAKETLATGNTQVYLYDRVRKVREIVSVRPDGTPSLGYATSPQVSADGRYVVFTSNDGLLVPGDTNRSADVFVRDRLRRRTLRVNLDYRGRQLAVGQSLLPGALPSISADGRVVTFYSAAFVTGDDHRLYNSSGNYGLYARDLRTGRVEAVARTALEGDVALRFEVYDAVPAPLSADGRYVTFAWSGPPLTKDAPANGSCLYRRDRTARQVTRLACAAAGHWVRAVTASADAGRVAYTELDGKGTFGRVVADLWLIDVAARRARLVESRPAPGGDVADDPALSADGRVLAFVRNAGDEGYTGPADDTENQTNQHRHTGTTVVLWHVDTDPVAVPVQASVNGVPVPATASYSPALSANGSVLALVTALPLLNDDPDLPGGERMQAGPGAADTVASANADDVYVLVGA